MTDNYTIKYSKRKTMGLYINKDAEIEVRVPTGTTKKVIENFVKKHRLWVNAHHRLVCQEKEARENFHLQFGMELLFLGQSYPLVPVAKKAYGFDGESFYAHKLMESEGLKTSFVKLYRELAKQVLIKIVEEMRSHMGLFPKAVKINGAKSRWGSCSGTGNLNFSWYLVMAEESTIRYVVVHELAHLMEMNHSPRFWKIVEQILPDYKSEREKLSVLQKKLKLENWE